MLNLLALLQFRIVQPEEVMDLQSTGSVADIIQPGIEIFGFVIMEPMTVLTDFLVSVVCFWAWRKLKGQTPNNATKFGRSFFFFLGWAATLGAIFGHGLIHLNKPYPWTYYLRLVGWLTSMLAVGFMERSAISHAANLIKPGVKKFFLGLNIAEMVLLTIITVATVKFVFVEVHSAYGFLLIILGFHSYTFIKSKNKGSKLMLLNTVVLLITFFIYNTPIIPHEWFNHRDLAHVAMAISCYIMYLAVLNMKETPKLVVSD